MGQPVFETNRSLNSEENVNQNTPHRISTAHNQPGRSQGKKSGELQKKKVFHRTTSLQAGQSAGKGTRKTTWHCNITTHLALQHI